jgi:hypothetical protein
MKNQIFIDDILHAYESEGNLHLVLGVVNGSMDEAGNDLRDIVTTLILPNNRASIISENLIKALKILLSPIDIIPSAVVNSSETPKEKPEFLGQGLRFPA